MIQFQVNGRCFIFIGPMFHVYQFLRFPFLSYLITIKNLSHSIYSNLIQWLFFLHVWDTYMYCSRAPTFDNYHLISSLHYHLLKIIIIDDTRFQCKNSFISHCDLVLESFDHLTFRFIIFLFGIFFKKILILLPFVYWILFTK